ncbi:hypothetical protein P9222_09215 [Paenibacillus amylolyticus]|nr:hypothetical protein [Paenibacillus amylolyticus]WFR64327.1 hypothetical protein P9222_09215 [Paenibacillus amylolyticus]
MVKTVIRELEDKVLVRCRIPDLENGIPTHAHEFWFSKEDFEKDEAQELVGPDQEGDSKCRLIVGMSDEEAIDFFESLIHNSK